MSDKTCVTAVESPAFPLASNSAIKEKIKPQRLSAVNPVSSMLMVLLTALIDPLIFIRALGRYSYLYKFCMSVMWI